MVWIEHELYCYCYITFKTSLAELGVDESCLSSRSAQESVHGAVPDRAARRGGGDEEETKHQQPDQHGLLNVVVVYQCPWAGGNEHTEVF